MTAPGGVSFASPLLTGWTLAASLSTDDLPKLTTATFIGIMIAITGNVLISLALNLQKLAHKRVEAKVRSKREEENGKATSTNSSQRRGPSLDERDEDGAQAAPPPAIEPVETEPLIPFPQSQTMSPTYGSVSAGASASSDVLNESQSQSPVTYRLTPPWHRPHKPRPSPSDVHIESVIPVDVMSEEAALRQQRPSSPQQKKDMLEDGNETEYLKSKLWWLGFFLMNVGETGNFISYAWAPASVVAPLGTVRVHVNLAKVSKNLMQ
ncbi:hypothetical protein DXG01_007939 [Tephrocybe rancida]|nr:hypothetical protein DXG01_007939 [Tephrocybe rancida]